DLVNQTAAARWLDFAAPSWIGPAIFVNDLVTGLAVFAAIWAPRTVRLAILAWAGVWLLLVAVVKVAALDVFPYCFRLCAGIGDMLRDSCTRTQFFALRSHAVFRISRTAVCDAPPARRTCADGLFGPLSARPSPRNFTLRGRQWAMCRPSAGTGNGSRTGGAD